MAFAIFALILIASLVIAILSIEVHVLPEVYVYASGIDTINVEFSSIDSKTNFTIHDVTRQSHKELIHFLIIS